MTTRLERITKYYDDNARKHNLKVVELTADEFYWHTDQEEPYGGWMITKDDQPIYFSTDEIEAKLQLEWVLFGGSEMIDGKLVDVKGFAEYDFDDEED